jgi:hypothetical protein
MESRWDLLPYWLRKEIIMAENWGTPEEVLDRKKKQLAETWAAFRVA